MTWSPPTPEEQVTFLRNVQRLLDEGIFTASYKFALLHAIADLCVPQGEASGAPLEVASRDIAEKFVKLYWQQCRPFESSGTKTGIVLAQNTGKQTAVIRKVVAAQQECPGSPSRVLQQAPDLWQSLIGNVRQTVQTMPLWKLQTVGSEQMDFLYDNVGSGQKITLKPGVAFCFRSGSRLRDRFVDGGLRDLGCDPT